MSPSPDQTRTRNVRRSSAIAAVAAGTSLAMLALSFAAVPLYRLYCATTGYGGAPRVAEAAPAHQGERDLTVRFDANVAPGLDWSSSLKRRKSRCAPEEPRRFSSRSSTAPTMRSRRRRCTM